jgi:hypothetical protein
MLHSIEGLLFRIVYRMSIYVISFLVGTVLLTMSLTSLDTVFFFL